ncbi:MAG: hypothetical protein FIB04_04775 [Gammaproteobacteria bacterium]|nr:hypothetical protein [Gammaproteobacteria bacterium]
MRPVVALAIALAAASCASGPGQDVASRTGAAADARATVAYGTLVFARERPELAAHARDYLTLVPVAVGPAGSQSLYFYGYVWSTIDKRGLRASDDAAGQFELIADDRRIPLAPVQATPDELGLAVPPVRAPSGSARLLIAATSRETLEFLAAAGKVRAVRVDGDKAERYELWSGNPDSLLAMR